MLRASGRVYVFRVRGPLGGAPRTSEPPSPNPESTPSSRERGLPAIPKQTKKTDRHKIEKQNKNNKGTITIAKRPQSADICHIPIRHMAGDKEVGGGEAGGINDEGKGSKETEEKD